MNTEKYTALETFALIADIYEEADRMTGSDVPFAKNEMKKCLHIWKHLLKDAGDDVKTAAFSRFSRWIREDALHNSRPVEKLWLEEFDDEVFINEKTRIIDGKIERASGEREHDYWIARRLSQMSDAIFEEKYRNNKIVRKYLIEKCIDEDEAERGISLLREARELAGEDDEMIEWCCRRLVKLLEGMNIEECRSELKDILILYMPGEMLFFRKLKRMYGRQEWKHVREELFEKIQGLPGTAAFYAEEGLYNGLIEYIGRIGDLEELIKYEEFLGSRYAVSIMQIYEKCLNEMVKTATRRSQYKAIAAHVRNVRRYAGGEQWAYRIVEQWSCEYSAKTAFMNELAKL